MKPHNTPGSHVKPPGERVTRHPEVTWTRLHHDLLKAVAVEVVTVHPDRYHRILGIRVHGSVEEGLGWLLFGGCIRIGDRFRPDGDLPELLTPLGEGVLRRWNAERGLVERTGGAE